MDDTARKLDRIASILLDMQRSMLTVGDLDA